MASADDEKDDSGDDAKAASKQARADGVAVGCFLAKTPGRHRAAERNDRRRAGKMAPGKSVGESVLDAAGEGMVDHEGKEAGREDTGTDDTSGERPGTALNLSSSCSVMPPA